MKLFITQFFQPITSSVFGPNMVLSAMFSNALSLCASLNARDKVPQAYKTKA